MLCVLLPWLRRRRPWRRRARGSSLRRCRRAGGCLGLRVCFCAAQAGGVSKGWLQSLTLFLVGACAACRPDPRLCPRPPGNGPQRAALKRGREYDKSAAAAAAGGGSGSFQDYSRRAFYKEFVKVRGSRKIRKGEGRERVGVVCQCGGACGPSCGSARRSGWPLSAGARRCMLCQCRCLHRLQLYSTLSIPPHCAGGGGLGCDH